MRHLISVLIAQFGMIGCTMHTQATNIIDLTEQQHIEQDGKICRETQMLIYPDRIEYYLPDCGVKRVVKTKPHFLPPAVR